MDIVGQRRWFFLLSLLVIAPGIAFLISVPGLKPGIDFTGGSSLTLDFLGAVEQIDLRRELTAFGQPDATVQKMEDRVFFVRTKELSEDQKTALTDSLKGALAMPAGLQVAVSEAGATTTLTFSRDVTEDVLLDELSNRGQADLVVEAGEANIFSLATGELTEQERTDLVQRLESSLSPSIKVLSFDLVSPVVAFETVRNAFWAVVAAAVGIFFYLWWAFRNVPSPFRYGAAAIAALLHDSIIVIGAFAILGELFDIEVNLMFLFALLTVIGYSVNDTIVVFDRLRENILFNPNRTLAANANASVMESIGRSLNTSLTLFFTLLALLMFGGETIRVFLWVLLIGVVAGTYSSIGIATNVLVAWEMGDVRRLFSRGSEAPEPRPSSTA